MANGELEDLEEYQVLQKDQEVEIARLEEEVQTMRRKHSEAIQKLKAQFLREKRGYQKESDSKIQEMAKQATQEAKHCLDDHTQKIKEENKVLRHELLMLIRRTRALHEHREELQAQHKALLREVQYGRDLKKLSGTRQNRLYKSFGLHMNAEREQESAEKGKGGQVQLQP
ncbi:predicted protein [Nematostella vectensis]|uniref:DUF4515 domain-containing protein n=2 Tax=Nematostella vectensis TaxID=45351 RepID=A7RUL4_NEMVE|nr:predicted protein [Nematostella vectensis]|eukprot:XP_001636986.1 predicted protein [Nematostella vectensis]